MKKIFFYCLLATAFLSLNSARGISLGDIQIWTGSGTNRAALVIEWSVPESTNYSTVPVPIADKTMVWGYRFNGAATGTQMLQAILTADPKLYVAGVYYPGFGTFVQGVGYNLNGDGVIGITDGTNSYSFPNGFLSSPPSDVDDVHAINTNDLYWSGFYGPNWEAWRETNELGGFTASPIRGVNPYWTGPDTNGGGFHGQWQLAESFDDPLYDGSWIGLTVAAGEYDPATNSPYNAHAHAPVSPDGTYVAYVCNTNDFAVQVISSSNLYYLNAFGQGYYSNALAVLGRPTLKFIDSVPGFGDGTVHLVKVVEPPYWTDPSSNDVITRINIGGQITVDMGRKIYHNPNNPYGIDFNVFGNSFYVDSASSIVGDSTDEATVTFNGSAGTYGHPTIVSVSQDGTNWYTYPSVPVLTPDNAYRWDDSNHIWTAEQMNETKPLNPAINFPSNTVVADALDQFVGAYGGSGYSLQKVGLPWIQYVRIIPGNSITDTNSFDYTVIDAIGAAHPAAVGDALSIMPANLIAGVKNLVFQDPANLDHTLISLSFDSVSDSARISTVSLREFSAFGPVVGNVCSAYQLQSRPLPGASAVALQADIGLNVGTNYSGNGKDLRVYQWNSNNWSSESFTFNSTNGQVLVAGVTNFSAFVISQIVPPTLSAQNSTNGFAFQFAPVANCPHILERSTDFVNWTPIYTNTPTGAQPITWQDPSAPSGKAFYRVRAIVP